VTEEEIFGNEAPAFEAEAVATISSISHSDAEEELEEEPISGKKSQRGEKKAVRRTRLKLKHKLAAIQHFQNNKMTHRDLAKWMQKTFHLEKEPDNSTVPVSSNH
jgi:uncharacterized protein with LGFP repeats